MTTSKTFKVKTRKIVALFMSRQSARQSQEYIRVWTAIKTPASQASVDGYLPDRVQVQVV